jgi:hypothetical protein
MTLWLQRQESVARFSAFREWMSESTLSSTLASTQPPTILPLPASSTLATGAEDDADTLIHHTYSISKQPPAATRRVLASHIIAEDGHDASRFLPALSHFLQTTHDSSYTPYHFDVFPTWKHLKFTLPNIPEVGKRHNANIVRTTAPVVPPGEARYRATEPAHHDFALVKTGEANSLTDGTAIHGLLR